MPPRPGRRQFIWDHHHRCISNARPVVHSAVTLMLMVVLITVTMQEMERVPRVTMVFVMTRSIPILEGPGNNWIIV